MTSPPAAEPFRPRLSRLAVASLALALLAWITWAVGMPAGVPDTNWWLDSSAIPLLLFIWGMATLLGVVLGYVGRAQIARSGGALTGRWMAVAAVDLSVLGFFVAPLVTVMVVPLNAKNPQAACLGNIRQLNTALLIYAEDYDDHLPLKSSWCDATLPYTAGAGGGGGHTSLYLCPKLPHARCGYAFNDRLDGLRTKQIPRPERMVLLFDARGGGWNLSGGPQLLDPRHHHGANVGYLDGHARWWPARRFAQLNFDPRAPEPPLEPSP